jgi:hypothetical protein
MEVCIMRKIIGTIMVIFGFVLIVFGITCLYLSAYYNKLDRMARTEIFHAESELREGKRRTFYVYTDDTVYSFDRFELGNVVYECDGKHYAVNKLYYVSNNGVPYVYTDKVWID